MTVNVRFLRIIPLLVLILVMGVSTVFAQEASKKIPVAMVVRINGALEYRTGSGEDWQAAKVKTPLYNGYQLRTALGNRALILYTNSGTRILVNENTELEISAETPGKAGSPERTKLIVGEVYSKISRRKAGYNYEVETPSSVASVRGTEFNATFGNGQATFLTMVNMVEVMNQLGSVLVNQYQQTTVQQGQAPGDPVTLSKRDAEKQTGWTDNVEPIWKLNIVPEGGERQAVGEAFRLTIWAENVESGMIDANASFALTSFTMDSDTIEFSSDNGKTWGGASNVALSNGQASLMARGTADGSVTLTAEAPDCEPASTTLTFAEPKEKKTMQLQFQNIDGTEQKSLTIELEEK